MKAKYFCVVISLLALLPIFGQSWFKTHDLLPGEYGEEPFPPIAKGGFLYTLVFADQYPPDNDVTQNLVLKYTNIGDIVWRKRLQYPAYAHADIGGYRVWGLAVAKDNSVYALTSVQNETKIGEFLLNKFNADGELLWFNTYGFQDTTVHGKGYGITLNSDSLGVTITGGGVDTVNGVDLYKKYAIVKVDSSGSLVWKRLLDVPLVPWFGSVGQFSPIVSMPDGSYRICYDNFVSTANEDYLAVLDSLGNLQSTYKSPFKDKTADIGYHPNGNVVYLSHFLNPPLFPHEWGGIRVTMMTPQLDTVWSRLFNDLAQPYVFFENGYVQNLSIAPDGRILAFGYQTYYGFLVCYSPDGQLLWSRVVSLEDFGPLEIDGAVWTPDGGILVDGYLWEGVGDYSARIFLLKLGGDGCWDPGCDETILTQEIVATHEPVSMGEGEALRVSPNPANEKIVISNISGKGAIEMASVLGKAIFSATLDGQESISVNIADFPTGIYFLKETDPNGSIMKAGRLVVHH